MVIDVGAEGARDTAGGRDTPAIALYDWRLGVRLVRRVNSRDQKRGPSRLRPPGQRGCLTSPRPPSCGNRPEHLANSRGELHPL